VRSVCWPRTCLIQKRETRGDWLRHPPNTDFLDNNFFCKPSTLQIGPIINFAGIVDYYQMLNRVGVPIKVFASEDLILDDSEGIPKRSTGAVGYVFIALEFILGNGL